MQSNAGQTTEPLPYNLADLLGQLGSAEVKHEPKDLNKQGYPVIGAVSNMVTRRVYSMHLELCESIEDIIGGPIENMSQLLDAMTGSEARKVKAKIRRINEQLGVLSELFWLLVKEECPETPEDSSGMGIYENWEVAALPPPDESTSLLHAFQIPLPSELLAAVARARQQRDSAKA